MLINLCYAHAIQENNGTYIQEIMQKTLSLDALQHPFIYGICGERKKS